MEPTQICVVKVIPDVDFGRLDLSRLQEEGIVRVVTLHGTVLLAKNVIEGAPDVVMPFGATDAEDIFNVAIYKTGEEIQKEAAE